MKKEIIRYRLLPEAQKLQIAQLVDQCCQHDHTHLVYPLEESNCTHYLLFSEGELLAVLALILYPHSHVECSAFTAPEHRQKGYFYDLMNEAEDEYEEYDVMFLVDEQCPDTVAAMEALGAEQDHQELQMELHLTSSGNDSQPALPEEAPAPGSDTSQGTSVTETCTTSQTSPDLSSYLLFSEADPANPSNCFWKLFRTRAGGKSKGKKLLGSCQILALSPHHACLHHMEIRTSLQGQGLGTLFLKLLTEVLARDGITRILLQVSDDNPPAIALYKKAGFSVTETLACYLY